MRRLPPLMYHFVDVANVDSIQRHGLLSANAILERSEFGRDVEDAVRAHRPHGVVLPDGTYIRDQAPMPPSALSRCLDPGLTPRDWYDIVNDHVFFWLSLERARRHRTALRSRPQLLITVDVEALVSAYGGRVHVTPFNVGNARRLAAKRGRRTLTPLARWQANGWQHEAQHGGPERTSSHPPAELLVEHSVPNIAKFIRHAEPIDAW